MPICDHVQKPKARCAAVHSALLVILICVWVSTSPQGVGASLDVEPYCASLRSDGSKDVTSFCKMTASDILALSHEDSHRLLLRLHQPCEGHQSLASLASLAEGSTSLHTWDEGATSDDHHDEDFYEASFRSRLHGGASDGADDMSHAGSRQVSMKKLQDPASALMGIYDNTNGPNWKNNQNWGNASMCYCDWFGVACAPCSPNLCQMGYCMVVALKLANNSLVGEYQMIEPYIKQFPYLTYLLLNDNKLSGSIPSFSNMGLQVIMLNGNRLSGTLPEVHLPQLDTFIIHQNMLSGPLPTFPLSSKLSTLSAHENHFEGQLPEFTSPVLNVISVHLNRLSGTLPQLLNCPYVAILSVQNNTISGTIPKYNFMVLNTLSAFHNLLIGDVPQLNCPSLVRLALHDNKLYGTIGEFLKTPLLEIVSLSGNQLVGTIPKFTLNNLKTFSAGSNRLTGSLPDTNQYPLINTLSLSDNQLSGTLPKFTDLPSLSVIDIGNNNISGTLPSPLGSPHLVAFLAPYNLISGTIPTFSGCPYLSYFRATSNLLSGSIPELNVTPRLSLFDIAKNNISGTLPEFTRTPYLSYLLVQQNPISGTVPEFKNLALLQTLLIYEMQLHGTLPDFNLPSLQQLYIVRNNLNGTIPDFKYLTSIQQLYFVYCKFEGTIPDFSHIPTLNHLYLADLDLHGTIPDFRNLPNLDSLYVITMDISGTIPNFSKIPKLRSFRAYQTQLTGELPDFSSIPKLETLSLYQTNIQGTIPDFNNLPNLKTLEIQQNKLNGSLPSFTKCLRLGKISAFKNQLTGSIPNWVLPGLYYLDIGHNSLTGLLPSFLGMPMLKSFIIESNNIEGAIPQSASMLSKLQEFVANNNKIRGKTPPYFLQLADFINLDLSSNMIEEDIVSFLLPVAQEDAISNLYFIHLQNNKLFGSLNYYIPYFFYQAREINLANNKLTSLDELPIFSGWERLNVSGNPIAGIIPETYSLFSNLGILDVSNTELKSKDKDVPVPVFLKASNTFEKSNEDDNYYCPLIIGRENPNLVVHMESGYYNDTFCQCLPNYFGKGSQCIHCDNPCECSGGTHLKGCYASTNAVKTVELLVCPYKTACNPHNKEEFVCKGGHTGRLCSRCESGYQQQGRKCAKCPYYATVVVLTLFPLGLILLLWYLITTPPKNTGVIKIFLFHMQTLSILSSTILDLGNGMNSFVDTAFVSSSFMLPALNCIVGDISAEATILIYLLRFPCMLVVAILFWRIVPGKNKNKVVFVSAFCIYAIYYGISRVTFGAIGCTLHDPGSDKWYLNMYPWIQCRPSTPEFDHIVTMSALFLVTFVIGLPVWTYFHLQKLFERFGEEEVEDSYGFLYLPYRKECYQWECVVLLRRLFFSLVITVVPYSQPTLLFFLLYVIIQISIWLQQSYKPYALERENRLEIASLYVIYFSFFAGLLSTLLNISQWLVLLVLVFNIVVASFVSVVYIIVPGARSFWSSLSNTKTIQSFDQGFDMNVVSPNIGSSSSWIPPDEDINAKSPKSTQVKPVPHGEVEVMSESNA